MERVLRTVLGDVDPDTMGATLAHEHVFIAGDSHWEATDGRTADPSVDGTPTLDTLWQWRENIDANRGNLRLDNESVAVREVDQLRSHGFGTIIDLTSVGLGANPAGLQRVSAAAGLNVVAGTGYYTGGTLPREVHDLSEAQMAEAMVRDIEVGIAGSTVKAGVIGEVGISWPIKPVELRSLAASVEAMHRTGAAISIHSPFHLSDLTILETIADKLRSMGADMNRVIIGHCDTYSTDEAFFDLAEDLDCLVQIDMFGNIGYEVGFDFWYPSDQARIDALLRLMELGMSDRVMVSQDCGLKTCLRTYGGSGYDYIPRVVVPRLVKQGAKQEWIDDVLVETPKQIFPLVPVASAK